MTPEFLKRPMRIVYHRVIQLHLFADVIICITPLPGVGYKPFLTIPGTRAAAGEQLIKRRFPFWEHSSAHDTFPR